jgi:EpsG-like putative glucosyltransferase
MQSNRISLQNEGNLKLKQRLGYFILIFTIIYLGTRPISGKYFIDMRTYANNFEKYADGESVPKEKDVYFEYFMKWCSGIMSVYWFFFLCAVLYVVPMFLFCKKIFQEYWFYAFIMLLTSLTFWSSGVNGIRSGIATSLILLAIANANRKIWLFLLLAIAAMFHKSMFLIIGAYVITRYYKNTKWLLVFWVLSIFLSAAMGGFWQTFFSNFGFEDDRLSGYLSGDQDEFQEAVKVGFRWDFLLYSASAVFAGWYFIFRKGYKDILYGQLFGMYLITNAFWILVIRANFSARFAYLSWFMMGIIIIYPFLKNQFFTKQHLIVGRILLIYFLFTYIRGIVFGS